jgi:hypothetical protein
VWCLEEGGGSEEEAMDGSGNSKIWREEKDE